MKRNALPALVIITLSACGVTPTQPVTEPAPIQNAIVDAAHGGINQHFFFLPPLMPEPVVTGVFDPSLSPVVELSEWTGTECLPISPPAIFTLDTGPGSERVRVDATNEHYIVNWHTNRFNLEPGKIYRIRVLLEGVELGFADAYAVSSVRELKDVNTEEFVALKIGRTLPIKFRIEIGDTPSNNPPIVYIPIPDQTATANESFTFQFSGLTFIDPDVGDALWYSATQEDNSPLPTWLTFTSSMRRFTGTPLSEDVGVIYIKVIATDGNGGIAFDVFSITVNEP